MDIFISTPMNGKSVAEIREAIECAKDYLYTKYEKEPFPVICYDAYYENASEKPLWLLGLAFSIMSDCDAAYFTDGWENARGCRLEHEAAEAYGLEIIPT